MTTFAEIVMNYFIVFSQLNLLQYFFVICIFSVCSWAYHQFCQKCSWTILLLSLSSYPNVFCNLLFLRLYSEVYISESGSAWKPRPFYCAYRARFPSLSGRLLPAKFNFLLINIHNWVLDLDWQAARRLLSEEGNPFCLTMGFFSPLRLTRPGLAR